MSFKFNKALVRKPSKSITKAISSSDTKPNYRMICDEHKKYIKSLIDSHLKVFI